MESGNSYQELKSKNESNRFMVILVTSISLVLCILVGVGIFLLVSGTNQPQEIVVGSQPRNVIEEIVIVEDVKPVAAAVVEEQRPPMFKENDLQKELNKVIYEEVREVINHEEETAQPEMFGLEEMPFLQKLVQFSNDFTTQILDQLADNEQLSALFNQQAAIEEGSGKSRQRRSLVSDLGSNFLRYFNYVTFGSFVFREIQDITEFAAEGRKLSGDYDSYFLDNGFNHEEVEEEVVEKMDNGVKSVEVVKKPVKKNKNRAPSAYDDGWSPMVNKVSLKFITEMLTTLLNLMREFLLRDNVMECLWFMFCKDMNHQAQYKDPMGYLARVNSVGLKVLVDKEGREVDTVTSVWQALVKWEALQCEAMFPKCDGSKALEIVNEVAHASR